MKNINELATDVRDVMAQGERAMTELGWTMLNVSWRRSLDAIVDEARDWRLRALAAEASLAGIKDAAIKYGVNDEVGAAIAHAEVVQRVGGNTAPRVLPGDMAVLPDGRCNGCELGWERYQNPNGIWLHRNASDTLGMVCWKKDEVGKENSGP